MRSDPYDLVLEKKLALMGVPMDYSPSNPYRFVMPVYPSVNCSGIIETSAGGLAGGPTRWQYGGKAFTTDALISQLENSLGVGLPRAFGTNNVGTNPNITITAYGKAARRRVEWLERASWPERRMLPEIALKGSFLTAAFDAQVPGPTRTSSA